MKYEHHTLLTALCLGGKQYVDDLYKEHLIEIGGADQLVQLGNAPEALELYVQQDNWTKVIPFCPHVLGDHG